MHSYMLSSTKCSCILCSQIQTVSKRSFIENKTILVYPRDLDIAITSNKKNLLRYDK